MRKEIELILRREQSEKKLKEAKKELEIIYKNCDHEIVVYLEFDYNSTGHEAYRYFKCLFCGDDSNFGFGKRIINLADADIFDTDEKKFELVKRLFIKTATEHPHTGLDKIVQIIQSKINKRNKDFVEIAEELRIPFLKKLKK